MKTTKLSKLTKGEYFKFEGQKKVNRYTGKVRMYDKWGKFKGWGFSYVPEDDVWSGGKEKFKDVNVQIGFDY